MVTGKLNKFLQCLFQYSNFNQSETVYINNLVMFNVQENFRQIVSYI